MTITSVLQKMYMKLSGGQKPKGTTTDEVLLEMVGVVGESSVGGALVVNVTHDEQAGKFVCDKTAGEMAAALDAGVALIFKKAVEGAYMYAQLYEAYITQGSYYSFNAVGLYETDSADDYPSADDK